MPLKPLSILCAICAAGQLLFHYLFPFYPDAIQPLWNYAIDPVIIVTIALVVAVNTWTSLDCRGEAAALQRLPMNIFTMFIGVVGIMYLHNYVLKFAAAFEVRQLLWDILVPPIAVSMAVSAIIYWRQANRA